jgi:SAM-dependent methyltransferase
MRSWPEFYAGRLEGTRYADYFKKRYAPFLDAIIGHVTNGDRLAEVGCGMASTTRALRDKCGIFSGYHCYDIDPEMVAMARANLDAVHNSAPVDIADARLSIGCWPDIIHSHGLLEHFDDKDIQAILDAGRASGNPRRMIHYVPGDGYKVPSRGDERLLPLEFWRDTFKPTTTATFNSGLDYILEWEC